ncbi:hypothetical protein SAMN05216223_11187 [Actinacidiphila yanglinensis]|uniref:Secreted protein n=1 Tax=Actinacidiphila yanglinensis TaxID=310779 RepID=A0A1H6D1Q8_9ACTN|nr:hypothetical protein [Actinacidiphila yanglinensis]SEG79004.1 hypothetical protein SAMN05216223_11187 [Actinacidiphila yanglinensis]
MNRRRTATEPENPLPLPARSGGPATSTRSARRVRAAPATAVPAALAAVLLAASLTACGGVHRAWDCAKTAATIAGDVQDLEGNATNIGQVGDSSRRQDTVDSLDKLQKDLDRIGNRHDNPALDDAVTDLSDSVSHARTSALHGDNPDIGPIAGAAGHLTAACAQG